MCDNSSGRCFTPWRWRLVSCGRFRGLDGLRKEPACCGSCGCRRCVIGRCAFIDTAFIARRSLQKLFASCFVTRRGGRIVGYYALSTGAVSHADCTGKFRRNMPDPMPVILLSRLSIDRKHQRRGLGENLFRDAVARSV